LPTPPTAAERLLKVRIVASVLGEQMITQLRSLGVRLRSKEATDGTSDSKTGDELQPTSISGNAAAQAQCVRLGLLSTGPQRSRLPQAKTGPPRIPACTLGLSQTNIWERFRQRCGTPLPSEPQAVACELKVSHGGGHVVVSVATRS